MEVSDFPNRKFKIMIIKMLIGQKSNAWTKWEFQKRDREYKK